MSKVLATHISRHGLKPHHWVNNGSWGVDQPPVIHAASSLPAPPVTVFMLGGAFTGLSNYMSTMLQGAITNGNNNIQVPYNNFGLFLNIVQQGAQMLDTYLRSGSGQMVAFGHGLGAVVCSYWLSNYVSGPISTTTISPASLSFTLIGNSVSFYGGALGPNVNAQYPNGFGANITVPAATPFTVTDIKRQYDGWADWPTGTMNSDALMNDLAGQGSIHPNYQNVNPSPHATGNYSYTAGNITYIWNITEPVPLLGTTWNSSTESLDATLRPIIESAYSRPVTLPAPPYSPRGRSIDKAAVNAPSLRTTHRRIIGGHQRGL
jgi:diacyltrehalose acyltransferase